MYTVIDGEWTITRIQHKDKEFIDGSPYRHTNSLVSMGVECEDGTDDYIIFNHRHIDSLENIKQKDFGQKLQDILDKTTLLVGHNLKADVGWLRECGFKYNGEIWDTMIYEYVTSCQKKQPYSLRATLEKYQITQKLDILDNYYKKGYNTDEIPLDGLIEYGKQDISSTHELFKRQFKNFDSNFETVLKLSNTFCSTLTDIERAGFKVDLEELDRVEKQFTEEAIDLQNRMEEIVKEVMGDTPINLNSPDDKCAVIYSVRVDDKNKWKDIFNLGTDPDTGKKKYVRKYKQKDFNNICNKNLTPQYKTIAENCKECDGGYIQKIKKDGSPYKKKTKCKKCLGEGFVYTPTKERAGLKVVPDQYFVSSSGFQADKDTINDLLKSGKLNDRAKDFIECLSRYNAVTTYVNSFCSSIRKYTVHDDLLHMSYNQCITWTGRLSSTFHNLPRGKTFPIKKVVTSRWEHGKILNLDFRTLEFRVAAILSGCKKAKEDVLNNVDVHSFTSKILTDAGEFTDRQDAKAHCFPMDTEILTTGGWKGYEEIEAGDKILNYNPNTEYIEQDEIEDIIQPHKQEIVEMYNSHNFKVRSTPNHKWFCDKRVDRGVKGRNYEKCVVETQNLNSEHRITTSSIYNSKGYNNVSGAKVLGWLWTDGSSRFSELTGKTSQGKDGRRQGCSAVIIQKKYIKEVEDCLKTYKYTKSKKDKSGCYIYYINPQDIRNIYNSFGLELSNNIDYEKFVLSLSDNARLAWLEAVIYAEGAVRKGETYRVSQNSGSLCEAIKLAGFLCGFDIRVGKTLSYTGKINEQISLRHRNYVTCQRMKFKTLEEQDVWCIKAKNNGSMIIRQGDNILISHNSFKPLYGGLKGTPAQETYYKEFLEKYSGIKSWHDELDTIALTDGYIRLPSGRTYDFSSSKRNQYGNVTGHTKIVNYPVQGFATADIMPLSIILLYEKMKEWKCKSKIIITVHDSVVLDVHPEEQGMIIDIIKLVFGNINNDLIEYFNLETDIPLEYEVSMGDNWMEQKEIVL